MAFRRGLPANRFHKPPPPGAAAPCGRVAPPPGAPETKFKLRIKLRPRVGVIIGIRFLRKDNRRADCYGGPCQSRLLRQCRHQRVARLRQCRHQLRRRPGPPTPAPWAADAWGHQLAPWRPSGARFAQPARPYPDDAAGCSRSPQPPGAEWFNASREPNGDLEAEWCRGDIKREIERSRKIKRNKLHKGLRT